MKRNLLNVGNALDAKSTEWHELYTRGRRQVLGYVAPRCISVMLVMGARKRAWACTERIMTAGRASLGGEKIERMSINSKAYNLDKARVRQKQLDESECSSRNAVWSVSCNQKGSCVNTRDSYVLKMVSI